MSDETPKRPIDIEAFAAKFGFTVNRPPKGTAQVIFHPKRQVEPPDDDQKE